MTSLKKCQKWKRDYIWRFSILIYEKDDSEEYLESLKKVSKGWNCITTNLWLNNLYSKVECYELDQYYFASSWRECKWGQLE